MRLQKIKKVDVLTGTHGDEYGGLSPERKFYEEDLEKWKGNQNVTVTDVTGMSEDKVKDIINSNSDTVCAWCFSEKTVDGMIDTAE
jgi:hypothetical protein